MLDLLRRQHSRLKWVWVILIFIFSATLVTLYIPVSDMSMVNTTDDVAEVGNQTVTAKEFQVAYRNYLANISSQISPEMLRAFRFEASDTRRSGHSSRDDCGGSAVGPRRFGRRN